MWRNLIARFPHIGFFFALWNYSNGLERLL